MCNRPHWTEPTQGLEELEFWGSRGLLEIKYDLLFFSPLINKIYICFLYQFLFIFSAIMHELPEKRLKVWAFLDAGITAKEQARAAGTAVTRR